MNHYAVFAHVRQTSLLGYSSAATDGVEQIAQRIITEIRPAFGEDLVELPLATVGDITDQLQFAAENLDQNGLCLFYFHGHGDSIAGRGRADEDKDEVLVCSDGYLFDDKMDDLLRNFGSNQRFLSIVDSCSSETAVEWSNLSLNHYPQIIHIASAKDEEIAGALSFGGVFSERLYSLIYNSAYAGMSYRSFTTTLEMLTLSAPCVVRKSDNVTEEFLESKLFN